MAEVNDWGYTSDEEVTMSSDYKFGLNTQAYFTKFEVNEGDKITIDVELVVGEKPFWIRLWQIDKVWYKDGWVTSEHPKFQDGLKKRRNQYKGYMSHLLKSLGHTDESITAGLAKAKPTSFKAWGEAMCGLATDLDKKPVDVFLQYQKKIKSGKTETYLEVPQDMSSGYFICASVPTESAWKEVRDSKGIHYVNEEGKIHPLTKKQSFLDSVVATKQKEGGEDEGDNNSPVENSSSNEPW